MGTGPRYKLSDCRKAAVITYHAFREIPRYIRSGITEQQLAWRMGWLLRKFGSQQRAFPTIVAFGSSAAEPHHKPTSRRLKMGDCVKIDAGAVYRHMRGDVTRTFFFGRPNKKSAQRYQAVLYAQQLAFANFKAGSNGKEIDNIARRYLVQQKIGHLFIHSLGHGVGRAIHQPPFLTPRPHGKRVLRVGEVITCEPGIYENGWGGIRIEDMVEITKHGPQWMGQAPKELKDICIDPDNTLSCSHERETKARPSALRGRNRVC